MLTVRTSYCGDLRKSDAGSVQVLTGWVQRRRDHGGLIFIDLRDRTGITQLVLDPQISPDAHAVGESVRSEYVLGVRGTVRERPEGAVNAELPTGEIEVAVHDLEVLNTAHTPPFPIEDEIDVNDDVRLTYRYLDMRRPHVAHILQLRHKAGLVVRQYMDSQGFLEIETPVLTKSTPEGARDFLIPSRLNPGAFYAMPQSPQLFKQMLMIAGVEKYFQIVRCFRDEDLRADRQPEFTQIDVEMSFAGQDQVFAVVEGLMQRLFSLIDVEVKTPFPRMSYADAISRYGSDKPDLRFGMELVDIGDLEGIEKFRIFQTVLSKGGLVKGICAPGGQSLSRREIDDLTAFVAGYGAKGLAWLRVTEDGIDGPIARFFDGDALVRRFDATPGDLLLFVADRQEIVHAALGQLRLHLARRFGLLDRRRFEFVWIVDFPLFHWNEDEERWDSEHHPFTAPHEEDLNLLDEDPSRVRSQSYDLAVNGSEIWSGSVRIHRREVQERIFRLLRLSDEDVHERFGFFLNALQFGTPPHAGIACGFDRLVTLLAGESSIREVIPFPKTQKGTCLVTGAPSPVTEAQLRDVFIRVELPKE